MILPISRSLLAAGGDVFQVLLRLDVLLHLLEPGDDVLDGLLHAALHEHRVGAGDDRAQALVVDGLGEDGGGGGAVAGHVAGLRGDLLDHTGAHVLVVVGQVDFLGDRDAVLGDGRRTEALLEDDVAPLGPESHLDGAGQLGDAPTHRFPCFLVERDLLRSHSASDGDV